MNQHSSRAKKYYSPLIGAALVAASLFHFSFPVFAAGTAAGTVLQNTATGNYEDDTGNKYNIESNTVEVIVAKVAGITNQPSGFTDNTTGGANTSVLTSDRVSFEFEITNVGNDASNIFIPSIDNITTKGLSKTTNSTENVNNLILQVSPALNADGTLASDNTAFSFDDIPANLSDPAVNPRPTNGQVENVPLNGKVLVKVTGSVTATAAGAPIEVLLGDTGSNTDPNSPVADTQNEADAPDTALNNEVRTVTASSDASNDPIDGQKEASALQQVFLGSNPLAMTRIEKTRVIDNTLPENGDAVLNNNVITYNLELEVLNTTPNSLYTPGQLEGRDFAGRVVGVDDSNLILISDAIPAGTILEGALGNVTDVNGNTWTAVYSETTEPGFDANFSPAVDQFSWTTTAPAVDGNGNLPSVTRVGWVYDANAGGPIDPGTVVSSGFTFNVVTSLLDPDGGTVANIAQVFGSTVDGDNVFDESGDQDPSNFNGTDPGPLETAFLSTGVADPVAHGTDSENNNNLNGTDDPSRGGEDNVVTIGAGEIINGPLGHPDATGTVFGLGADNDHDFQNLGVFYEDENVVDADGKPIPIVGAKHNEGTTFDPAPITFENTLSNSGDDDLANVLLQPINPEYDPAFNGSVTDDLLPQGTTVKITLGGQEATYEYQVNPDPAAAPTDRLFVLTDGIPILIPTLVAGVPLDYTVEVDLPLGTGLSTDDAINSGFPVPVIAFIDEVGNENGTPDVGETANVTVNQVYTGYVKIFKQVRVLDADGALRPGMGFVAADSAKTPFPGDQLEYRVIYRNISEPQAGTGNNGVLNGIGVRIDENGVVDYVDDDVLNRSGNNWGLDNNNDGDIDTINVQNSAEDSNNGTINYFTSPSDLTTITSTDLDDLVPAGTVDPGDTVTGYRVTIPFLVPNGAEADSNDFVTDDDGDSVFTFIRKVDEFDGLAQEGLEP